MTDTSLQSCVTCNGPVLMNINNKICGCDVLDPHHAVCCSLVASGDYEREEYDD